MVDWALAFYNAHGKTAIRLNKEVPGHLVNRLQAAIWREAIDAVVSGVASVADVDKAIAYGPGLRWALMGPHQIFHLAGGPGGMRNFLEHFGPNIENWWRDMRDVTLTPEVLAAERDARPRNCQIEDEFQRLLNSLRRFVQATRFLCDQGEERGEQLLNRRGLYEKGLLFFLSSVVARASKFCPPGLNWRVLFPNPSNRKGIEKCRT